MLGGWWWLVLGLYVGAFGADATGRQDAGLVLAVVATVAVIVALIVDFPSSRGGRL